MHLMKEIFFTFRLFLFRVDTYDSKPYWFSNYTEIYARLVAKNYSDLVIGELTSLQIAFFSGCSMPVATSKYCCGNSYIHKWSCGPQIQNRVGIKKRWFVMRGKSMNRDKNTWSKDKDRQQMWRWVWKSNSGHIGRALLENILGNIWGNK